MISETGTSRSTAMLTGTPGHRKWIDVGDGPIRGLLRVDAQTLLVASGSKLYRINPSKVATELGPSPGLGWYGWPATASR